MPLVFSACDQGNGKGEKKKGKKGKKGTDPAATGDDVGKEENENHKEGKI